MVYLMTGQPGSGKTTLAKAMIENSFEDYIHLDGDTIRAVIKNEDYTKEGRKAHIKNIYNMAKILHNEGKNVVISMVSPFRELRESLKKETEAIELFLFSDRDVRKRYHVDYYEKPLDNFIGLDTDLLSVEEELDLIPNYQNKNYELFLGRYQPLHDGHKWLFNQQLKQGKNILIGIRNMTRDEKNPYTSTEVKNNIEKEYREYIDEGRIKVIILPNITSVNYGRNVGYEINQYTPPNDIKSISATKIRQSLYEKS